jgi:hypothetical protein
MNTEKLKDIIEQLNKLTSLVEQIKSNSESDEGTILIVKIRNAINGKERMSWVEIEDALYRYLLQRNLISKEEIVERAEKQKAKIKKASIELEKSLKVSP